jgi:hypothetical protein
LLEQQVEEEGEAEGLSTPQNKELRWTKQLSLERTKVEMHLWSFMVADSSIIWFRITLVFDELKVTCDITAGFPDLFRSTRAMKSGQAFWTVGRWIWCCPEMKYTQSSNVSYWNILDFSMETWW